MARCRAQRRFWPVDLGHVGDIEIPKDKIIDLIRQKAGGEKADQAAGELPDQVDPDKHSDLLAKFGIDPKELLSGGPGGITGNLGL